MMIRQFGRMFLVSAAVLAAGCVFAAAANVDDSAMLQGLLDAGKGTVVFPDGTFTVSRPLLVSSDTKIVCSPRTVVRLSDELMGPVLMNRDERPFAKNITVEGGVWDGNNVGPTHLDYPKLKQANFKPGGGNWGQLVVFAGVKHLTLRDLTVRNPDSYCIELTDVEYFTVENITFDCNERTLNEDGLHIDGAARHGYIRNIRGQTHDDLVALNADEGEWRSADNDIEDILIDGVYGGTYGYTGVRLLSRNAKIRNVVIRNVYGQYRFNGISFTHWASPLKPGMGHFDNIVIENVFASSCMRQPNGDDWGMILFQGGCQSVGAVTIRNLRRVEEPGYTNRTATIRIGRNVKIKSLLLDNVSQSLPDGKPLIDRHPSAVIENFVQR